ncbi:hypothetical protein BGZ46_005288 [Entomortierella lignicola]|nr:hypothetical protein BGZ46_005288 [Entomortierella lignicola]
MSSPTSTDVSSIVPGSIFPDDTPSPTITDGIIDSSPSPQSQISPPPESGSSDGQQIEVNSTTQIVLISLGVIVGVLFLVGVIATYYISHKNSKARDIKDNLESAELPVDVEKGVDPNNKGENEGQLFEVDMTESQANLETDKENNSDGNASSTPSTSAMGFVLQNNNGGSVNPFSTPTGSQLGFGMTATGTTEPLTRHNNRSSINDVANVYTHRQSMIDPLGAHPLQSVSAYQDSQLYSRQSYYHEHQNQRPTPYPMESSGEGSTSVLLDPFKTNNNSTSSLDVLANQQKSIQQIPESYMSHNRSSSSGSMSGRGGPGTLKDWEYQQEQHYAQDVQQSPISAPIVISDASVSEGDISYQPPSQPISPIHSKESPTVTSPRTPFRNGAAVFEGIALPRAARPSLDESEAGNTTVSLPSPRDCLLETAAASREEDDGDASGQEFIMDQQDMNGAYLDYGLHLQQGGKHQQFQSNNGASHPYPQVVRRALKQQSDKGKGMVRSSYLDDYCEQQQQQESSGSESLGRKSSTKILKRMSLYSSTPVDIRGGDMTVINEEK